MHVYGEIIGTLSGAGSISGELSPTVGLSGALTVPSVAGADKYNGPYEFTPSAETQRAEIYGKMGRADIVINPIPSNYGLVTYDGAIITVS